jgi:flavin-dependent dehydrogenase
VLAGQPDFIVIGAGPAGAAAAAKLARMGFNVTVFEALDKPAVKPCGLGIPLADDLPVKIPKDTILAEIDGARLYVDGVLAVEIRGWLKGYIVDKQKMLEAIIIESGSNLLTKSFYDIKRNSVKSRGSRMDLSKWKNKIILAGGWAYYIGEKIAAVQVVGKVRDLEPDMLDIMFDTELVGYYWVFPLGDEWAEIGVGGYADHHTLIKLLERFIKRNRRITHIEGKPKGAKIAVGGVNPRKEGYTYLVGEAAGFVLPLTGEGIRPSMVSGAAAAEALAEGRDPIQAQKSTKIARAIKIHRKILDYIKGKSARERREILLSIPAEVHAEVALGTLNLTRIAKALALKPRLAASILKIIKSG